MSENPSAQTYRLVLSDRQWVTSLVLLDRQLSDGYQTSTLRQTMSHKTGTFRQTIVWWLPDWYFQTDNGSQEWYFQTNNCFRVTRLSISDRHLLQGYQTDTFRQKCISQDFLDLQFKHILSVWQNCDSDFENYRSETHNFQIYWGETHRLLDLQISGSLICRLAKL